MSENSVLGSATLPGFLLYLFRHIPIQPHSNQSSRPVVLVVDDEPIVKNFVQFSLTRSGFHVLPATSAQEALDISREYDGFIDLLITDVKMPGMSGPRLAEMIEHERPLTKILLMTGNSYGEIPHCLRPAVLNKPFLVNTLLERIAVILQAPVPAICMAGEEAAV